ncbi:MAG: uracil-DNA glycosylase family protein [Enterococcus sp.]
MTLFEDIMDDPINQEFTQNHWHPVYRVPATAKIVIIGQAPSLRVQQTEVMWNDPSGDRLRNWLGVSREVFYSDAFGVIPMDFYFPGKGQSGDKPPRKGIAEKWHPQLLAQMPNVQLIILVGAYAQRYYLNLPKVATTAIVKNGLSYLPTYLPIVHPSPRNNIWLKKNPWFEAEIVPELQKIVAQIL